MSTFLRNLQFMHVADASDASPITSLDAVPLNQALLKGACRS